MKEHGLDLADVSIGFKTDDMQGEIPIGALGGMVKNGTRVRTEVGLPVATSWNLGQPELANKVIEEDLLDLVYLLWALHPACHPPGTPRPGRRPVRHRRPAVDTPPLN